MKIKKSLVKNLVLAKNQLELIAWNGDGAVFQVENKVPFTDEFEQEWIDCEIDCSDLEEWLSDNDFLSFTDDAIDQSGNHTQTEGKIEFEEFDLKSEHLVKYISNNQNFTVL